MRLSDTKFEKMLWKLELAWADAADRDLAPAGVPMVLFPFFLGGGVLEIMCVHLFRGGGGGGGGAGGGGRDHVCTSLAGLRDVDLGVGRLRFPPLHRGLPEFSWSCHTTRFNAAHARTESSHLDMLPHPLPADRQNPAMVANTGYLAKPSALWVLKQAVGGRQVILEVRACVCGSVCVCVCVLVSVCVCVW